MASSSSSSAKEIVSRGIKLASQATNMEQRGDHAGALDRYCEAVDLLIQGAAMYPEHSSRRAEVKQRAETYLERVEALELGAASTDATLSVPPWSVTAPVDSADRIFARTCGEKSVQC